MRTKFFLNIFALLLSFFDNIIERGRLHIISPQQKLMQVNAAMNNAGIGQQQGTTRIVYDTLPIDGRTEYKFFKDSNTRQYPRTNLGSSGGKLDAGETMVIARYYLSIIEATIVGDTWTVVSFLPCWSQTAFVLGELNVILANNKVIKNLPLLSAYAPFNKSAMIPSTGGIGVNDASVFEFETQLVIPPLLDFEFDVQIANPLIIADTFLRLTIEGVGSILAPRTTF